MALHGLYILEMKRGTVTLTSFGTYDECLYLSKMNEERFECTVRPAHYDDVELKIAALQDELAAVRFDYSNSPWGMGPQYRQQIETLEDRIRQFRKFLAVPSLSPRGDGQAPADQNPLTEPAGATMTLAQAEDAAMRPDTDDATLLAACKVIDRESRDQFLREISARIVRHFEERTLEVE